MIPRDRPGCVSLFGTCSPSAPAPLQENLLKLLSTITPHTSLEPQPPCAIV